MKPSQPGRRVSPEDDSLGQNDLEDPRPASLKPLLTLRNHLCYSRVWKITQTVPSVLILG